MLRRYVSLASRFAGRLPASPGTKPACDQEDARLIAAARRGDSGAFESLVRKYQDRLYSRLYLVCGSVADAQDAAQEAFLKAYLKLNTFNSASAFYSWLYRIAVNAVISQHRRKMAHLKCERLRAHQEEIWNAERQAPDKQMLAQERGACVQDALATLSPEHRLILVLREIDDCEYDEIARLLDIPVGTVRSRLHRARLLLREKLTDNVLLTEASDY